ncbi:hypothetical protein ABFP60_05960 [Clostridioides difficile]
MTFLYLLIVFFILLLLSEIMAILLKLTGLDMDKARFQVISIITHTGFTTRESELIAQHPKRRRLVSYLMLLSYVGQATFFSLLVSAIKDEGFMNLLIISSSIILIIIFLFKSSNILIKFDPLLYKFISKRWIKSLNTKPIEKVLYINEEYEVIEFVVSHINQLCNIHLKDFKLDFIKVLLIDKGHTIIPIPNGNDLVEEGDRVIIYGRVDKLKELII